MQDTVYASRILWDDYQCGSTLIAGQRYTKSLKLIASYTQLVWGSCQHAIAAPQQMPSWADACDVLRLDRECAFDLTAQALRGGLVINNFSVAS